jgi:hypothetical protein
MTTSAPSSSTSSEAQPTENTDPDPDSLGFVLDANGAIAEEKAQLSSKVQEVAAGISEDETDCKSKADDPCTDPQEYLQSEYYQQLLAKAKEQQAAKARKKAAERSGKDCDGEDKDDKDCKDDDDNSLLTPILVSAIAFGVPASVFGLFWETLEKSKNFVGLKPDQSGAIIQNRWKPKTPEAQGWLSGLIGNLANWVPQVSRPAIEIGGDGGRGRGGTTSTPDPPKPEDPKPADPRLEDPKREDPRFKDLKPEDPQPEGGGGEDKDPKEQSEYLLLKRRISPPVSRLGIPASLKVLFANQCRGLLECKEGLSSISEQLKATQAELQTTKDALKRAKGKEPKPGPGDAKKNAKITEL